MLRKQAPEPEHTNRVIHSKMAMKNENFVHRTLYRTRREIHYRKPKRMLGYRSLRPQHDHHLKHSSNQYARIHIDRGITHQTQHFLH
jgi:hypothetical protein